MTANLPITPLAGWIAAKLGAVGRQVSPSQLAAYQLHCLRKTVARVQTYSPFYRQQLAGFHPDDLTSLTAVSQLPFTTAADLAAHNLKLICGSQSQINRVVTLNTSGTTGNPKRLYFSRSDQQLTVDFFACGMSTLVEPGDKTLILLPGERPGSVGDLLRQGLLAIGVEPIPYGLAGDTATAVEKLCTEQATSLVGVPVQVLAMAKYWEKFRPGGWAPRCALLSTDYVSKAVVSELNRIWNCEIYDHYGMTEMGLGGGLECRAHDGYHLRENDLYFEIIDPESGQVLPDGEYGEVVFTTLTREGMPLIRYRTGDLSRFHTNPCACGSCLRRLEKVRSRLTGQLPLMPHQTLSMADLDEALLPLPGVVNFTASLSAGSLPCLQTVVEILPPASLETAGIVQAVTQIPAVQAAVHAGLLTVEAKISLNPTLFPGKRSIYGEMKEAADHVN